LAGYLKRCFNWRDKNRIRPAVADQRVPGFRKASTTPGSLPKFLAARINRLQASQNAAALLFELGTVDIR
jgi:hypothetical protein